MKLEEMTFADLGIYIIKRLLLLVAKLCGFKGFGLFFTTWLLHIGEVGQGAWLGVMLTVLGSAGGTRIADCISMATMMKRSGKDENGDGTDYGADDDGGGVGAGYAAGRAVERAAAAGERAGKTALERGRARLREAYERSRTGG